MTAAAARGYVDLIRPLALARAGDLGSLDAASIEAFVLEHAARFAPKTMQRLISALRSFSRFAFVTGGCGRDLSPLVPRAACPVAAPPRYLEPGQVSALLASCDRASAAGLRDYAMIVTMARLGLRRGEIAALELDDIGWRAGELTVRGKGPRQEKMPLVPAAGAAIAAWLRDGRPATAQGRAVFTRVKAPHHGLSPGGVTQAVAAASARAGIGTVYAHRLRHTAATEMLNRGASLGEVGLVLRHRSELSTSLYAKVDFARLATLARPWPGRMP